MSESASTASLLVITQASRPAAAAASRARVSADGTWACRE